MVARTTGEVEEIVREVCTKLQLFGADDTLVEVDSLAAIDLVLELEKKLGQRINPAALTVADFRSVDAIVNMVLKLPA